MSKDRQSAFIELIDKRKMLEERKKHTAQKQPVEDDPEYWKRAFLELQAKQSGQITCCGFLGCIISLNLIKVITLVMYYVCGIVVGIFYFVFVTLHCV